jgi:hypothetical protein
MKLWEHGTFMRARLVVVEDAMIARDHIVWEVRKQLWGAQNQMKQVYDKGHS